MLRYCRHICRYSTGIVIDGQKYATDEWTNITPRIIDLTSRKLHLTKGHPIHTLRNLIANSLDKYGFQSVTPQSAVVSVQQNFDDLDFPAHHPGRARGESYYLNKNTLLRTHTSAHELEHFRAGLNRWLLTADVYRRDQIDASHYPAFHQCEGACVGDMDDLDVLESRVSACQGLVVEDVPHISLSNQIQSGHERERVEKVARHLKLTLTIVIDDLLSAAQKAGIKTEKRMRWIEASFPWTQPSYELEIFWHGQWLEVLGCGVMRQETLSRAGITSLGWAFGLGLDRLALILYGIPDIRLLWSTHSKFNQFQPNQVSVFKPWSRYSAITRDLSFFVPPGVQVSDVDVAAHAREEIGDWCQSCELIDHYGASKTYRLTFQSLDVNLTSEQVNEKLKRLTQALERAYKIKPR